MINNNDKHRVRWSDIAGIALLAASIIVNVILGTELRQVSEMKQDVKENSEFRSSAKTQLFYIDQGINDLKRMLLNHERNSGD